MPIASQDSLRPASNSRELHFHGLDDCLAEVERIRAAAEAGRLTNAGNWTPGQALAHVAAWIEYGFQGYPMRRPPFFVRWILRWRLPKMLQRSMPRGVRIPGVKGGTCGIDDMPAVAAAERLAKALHRLRNREPAPFDSPAFGPMSYDDRIRLNLRHAELHLGYLAYE